MALAHWYETSRVIQSTELIWLIWCDRIFSIGYLSCYLSSNIVGELQMALFYTEVWTTTPNNGKYIHVVTIWIELLLIVVRVSFDKNENIMINSLSKCTCI